MGVGFGFERTHSPNPERLQSSALAHSRSARALVDLRDPNRLRGAVLEVIA